MEVQVAADRRVRQPGAPEERRRLERAAGDDDGTRAHLHRPGVDADGRAALDEHAARVHADEHAAPAAPRRRATSRGALLRAERAAEAAVAADAVLVAAAHVARLRADVPAERLGAALEHAIAPGRRPVLAVDVHPLLDGVEAARELVGRERGTPCAAHSARTSSGGRSEVVQFTVVPPPRHQPARKSTDWSSVAPRRLRGRAGGASRSPRR